MCPIIQIQNHHRMIVFSGYDGVKLVLRFMKSNKFCYIQTAKVLNLKDVIC